MSAPEGTGGGGIGDKSSSASSSVGGGKPVSSGGGGGGGTSIAAGQLSGTLAVAGGAGAVGVSAATVAAAATTTIPIDLASASKVLVRTDKTTMPTTTYRIGSAPGNQMRVVIPSSAAQQTYYRQPANIKQDTTTNRTQISALSAARTVVTQTASLTVSRAQTTTPTTVSYHVSNRCVPATPIVTANLPPGAVRATTINGPIRISTPPIQVATNNTAGGGNSGASAGVVSTGGSTTYVRMPPNVLPARSSAQAAAAATTATIISQSNHNNSTTTTLVPNFQMSAQLIRATGAGTVAVTGGGAAGVGGGVPRARVVTQTTIPTNHHPVVVASGGTATPLAVVNSSTPIVGGSQGVVAGGGGGQQTGVAVSNTSPQAFVATLSTVLQAPRQVSTLVYTNNSATQQYTIGPNQQQQHRLALATTTLSPQRPTTLGGVGLSTPGTGGIRPTIQRLPTAGIRVSNFRPPGLASTTVLTTIASGVPGVSGTVTNSSQSAGQQQLQQQRTVATGTVVAPNISNAIPARIIQVQNPASGTAGTAQIVNGRIQTNLLNIQPLIVSNQNRLAGPVGSGGGLQPAAGLTIAQVGKLTQVATGAGNDPITTSAATATLQTASGQQIVVSTTGPGGGASPAATLIAGNLIGSGGTTHHGGQITHQIVGMNAPTVVSVATGAGAAGAGGAGTATTVIPIPLALTGARQATVGATSGHSPLSIVTGPGPGGASLGGIVRTGGTSGVVGTGTATSIASVLPIAKVTPQQQQQPLVTSLVETNVPNTAAAAALHYSVASGVVGAGPSLYIQTRPGVTSGGAMAVATSSNVGVPKGPAGATLSVVSSTGTGGGAGGGTSGAGASATTFLPTSTFYYERLTSSPAAGPVSIAAATSGGSGTSGSAVTLSSSTAITTTSAISGPVFSISSSSSVISSSASNSNSSTSSAIQSQSGGPHHSVVSSLTSYGASGSFAIVQAAPGGGQGGRATLTSGPIHGLVPASLASAGGAGGNVVSTTVGGSIVSVSRDPSAAVVVGGSGGAGGGGGGTTGGTTTTTQIVPIRFHPQLLVDASGHHQAQQIIVSSSAGPGGGSTATNIVPLIPMNATSINVTSTSTGTGAGSKQHQVESPQSSILRKRALEGTLKTLATPAAGRDLTQALMAVEKQQQQQELTLQLLQQHSALQHQPMELRGELIGSPMSPSRPPSSDGSTTVSATSTPGLDDQEDSEMRPIPYRNSQGGTSTALVLDGGHFKPVQEELPHFQQQQQQQQHHLPRELVAHHHHHGEGFITTQSAASSSGQTVTQIVNHHMAAVGGSSSAAGNGSSYEQSSARKKARKQLLQPMSDSGTVGPAGGSLMKSSSSSSSSSSSAATTGTATGQTSSQQQQQVFMAQDHVDGVTIGADGSSYAMSAAGPGIVILTTGGAQHHLASTGSHKHNSVSGAVPKPIGGAGSSNSSSSLHNNVKLEPPTAASGQQQQQQQDAGAAPAPQPGGGSVPSTKPIVSSSRKTNNVSLLQSYKQTWKAANNHFQRYTDVKQREERRPTVMDIANQSHILQKVNGWKIYHLSAQIEELCDLESQAYGKLAQMLRSMEASGSGSSSSSSSASGSVSSIKSSSTDIERINDLLKGNMQRSKIVMDGINEARTQIMKIFDHKPRVSDIILRCASKRNFKKREKT